MKARRLAMAAACLIALAGCVQPPTEKQGAVDMRPRIGFDVVAGIDTRDARVWVDGLDAGPLVDFEGQAGTLAVLPGNHLVQVKAGSRMLFEQRLFLPDGAQRRLNVSAEGRP